MSRIAWWVLPALALAVGGCAEPKWAGNPPWDHGSGAMRLPAASAASPAVREVAAPYEAIDRVPYVAPGRAVSLHADGAPVGSLLREILKPLHWNLAFAQGASSASAVTVSLDGVSWRTALRQVAFDAGYVAVLDRNSKTVTLAKRATYLYRLPTGLFSGTKTDYMVGGSAGGAAVGGAGGGMGGASSMGGAGGGSSAGMGGASGSSGSQGTSVPQARFMVGGTLSGETSAGLQQTIQSMAGAGAQVNLDPVTGLLSVTANAGGLARVSGFLRHYVRVANTRVMIHAAILQVQLNGDLQWGINWQKVIQNANRTIQVGIVGAAGQLGAVGAAASGTNPFTLTYTTSSVTTVINALRNLTSVRVLSQPALLAQNGTPATLYSGKSLPFVGSIQSNITGLSGSSSTSAGVSYATNGLSLSLVPNVLPDDLVSVRLVPSITRVEGFQTFQVGSGTITGPVQDVQQAFLQVLIRSGRTAIIGASRQTQRTGGESGVPELSRLPVLGLAFKGVNRGGQQSQLIILLRARVLPPPLYNPIVGSYL